MVKMNGCTAIDFRPSVSLLGRQGSVCRRFPFKEMALAIMERTNSKQIKWGHT